MLMKLSLALLLLSTAATTNAKTIIPSKTILNPFYLYSDWSLSADKKQVHVVGQTFALKDNSYVLKPKGLRFDVPLKNFLIYRQLAQSVFQTKTTYLDNMGHRKFQVGSAVLVGPSHLLTNLHVVMDPKACQVTVVTDPAGIDIVKCEKALYCDDEADFCLIKMGKNIDGKELGEIAPLISISSREQPSESNEAVTILGNHDGRGIQVGRGQGLKHVRKGSVIEGFYQDNKPYQTKVDVLIHYAPSLVGSSGGPLLNDDGEMIALNYGALANSDSININFTENAVNTGVPSSFILNKLKKNLSENDFKLLNVDNKIPSSNAKIFAAEWTRLLKQISSDNSSINELVSAFRDGNLKELNKKTKTKFLAESQSLSKRELLYLYKLHHPVGAFEDRMAFLLKRPKRTPIDHFIACGKQKVFSRICLTKIAIWSIFRNSPLEIFNGEQLNLLAEIIMDEITTSEDEQELKDRFRSAILTDRNIAQKHFIKCLSQVEKISLLATPLFDDRNLLGNSEFCREEFMKMVQSSTYVFPDSLTHNDLNDFYSSYLHNANFEIGYLSRKFTDTLREGRLSKRSFTAWSNKYLDLLDPEEKSFHLIKSLVVR